MNKIVKKIAKELKKNFMNEINAITVYGSFAQNTPNKGSDIDYYVVLKTIKFETLKKINLLKIQLEKKYGIKLSINIIKESELPKIRKKAFYHKNRYALFLHESNKVDKILIGKNPFFYLDLPKLYEIRLEAIRIINSFAYIIRKSLVNKGETDSLIKDSLRFCIYATQYANACKGKYPLKTSDSIKNFVNNFKDFKQNKVISKFYKIKRHIIKINDNSKIIKEAIIFLESLDEYLFNKYKGYLIKNYET